MIITQEHFPLEELSDITKRICEMFNTELKKTFDNIPEVTTTSYNTWSRQDGLRLDTGKKDNVSLEVFYHISGWVLGNSLPESIKSIWMIILSLSIILKLIRMLNIF